jgi:hypothetical protein
MRKGTQLSAYIILASICCAVSSCMKGLLDKTPKESLTADFVWSDPTAAQQFVNGIYGDLPHGFSRNFGEYMLDAASDDGDNSFTWTENEALKLSNFVPLNSPLANQWGAYYALVRKTNIALTNLNSLADAAKRDQLKGEAYYLRGFIYSELLRFYAAKLVGSAEPTGLPIVDKPLTLEDNFQIPRSTYDETVDFIVKSLDSSAILLPSSYSGTPKDVGRATRGAALSLKSRVLLYAKKWIDAAAAAKEVIDHKADYGYGLYPDYRNLFLAKNNQEVIFAKKFKQPEKGHPYDQFQYPVEVTGTGWGGLCPTQNLVDDYEMTDGKPYNQSPLYNPNNPYINRDPRFDATVLHNGSIFQGQTIEIFNGGINKPIGNSDATKTGYYARKFHDTTISPIASRPSDQDWVYLRYAEILLNYAEAQNEASGPDASVYAALNEIRQRPGVNMPVLPAGLSQSQMRDAIRHERRIELAFEEHRYFDVRRWGIAKTVLNGQFYTMSIDKVGGGFTYQLIPYQTRAYNDKNIVLPIPQTEIDKNPAAKQIAGW